jgi:hypothetical protein
MGNFEHASKCHLKYLVLIYLKEFIWPILFHLFSFAQQNETKGPQGM